MATCVWSIQHRQLYANFCSLDKTFLSKVLYTPSLLPILHKIIPYNTWYNRCNTQFIMYIRRHTITAHHLNSYCCPHKLPAITVGPTRYRTWHFFNSLTLMRILQWLQTHYSSFLTQRTYSCSNFIAISSLVLEVLKKCRVW